MLSPLRYLFICTLLPSRPLNSLPPCINSIFYLADCCHPFLRSWLHNNNASPISMIVPSSLGPPWPARPGYLHPFVHRLTKEISPWFNPFNELAFIPSSLIHHQLFASGRGRTSHIYGSSDRLPPATWLFSHSPLPKFAQC